MDEKIKTCTLRFPAPQKTLIWRRHWSIGQSCRSMTSKRSIDWFLGRSWAWSFFIRAFAYPPKATRVCIRSTNQSHRCIFVRLLFCLVRAFSFQGHTKIALTWGPYSVRYNESWLQTLTLSLPSPHDFVTLSSNREPIHRLTAKRIRYRQNDLEKTLLQWKNRLYWDSNDDICNVWTVL